MHTLGRKGACQARSLLRKVYRREAAPGRKGGWGGMELRLVWKGGWPRRKGGWGGREVYPEFEVFCLLGLIPSTLLGEAQVDFSY